jgi:Trk-type K+ transport system membrane component
MENYEFVLEVLVTSIILTGFMSYNNYRIRRKMRRSQNAECLQEMSFFLKHPYFAFLFNLVVFILVTILVKWLNTSLFGGYEHLTR